MPLYDMIFWVKEEEYTEEFIPTSDHQAVEYLDELLGSKHYDIFSGDVDVDDTGTEWMVGFSTKTKIDPVLIYQFNQTHSNVRICRSQDESDDN